MKFYFISPLEYETPGLYETFRPTFIEQGHTITNNLSEANVVFFDIHSRIGGYDWFILQDVIRWRLPVVAFDATDFGGTSWEMWAGFENFENLLDIYNKEWANFLKSALANCRILYFMRKMNKTLDYPSYVFPYELCQYPDCDFPLTTPEELQSRPYEIFFRGNYSPQRESVCNELSKHFNCDFELGQERIPQNQWIDRARKAKLFLTADGGGYGDERPYQLISISPMIRQINQQKLLHDWTNGVNCVLVSEQPTYEEIRHLKYILNHPTKLYQIYSNGVQYMKDNYSQESRAKYILDTIKNNL